MLHVDKVRPSASRLTQLDGVRGWASLTVFLSHIVGTSWPDLTSNVPSCQHWIARTPVHLFYDGALAVQVFFVLSGFVIANVAIRRRDSLVRNLIVRYLRLTIPVLASICFAVVLLLIFPREMDALRARLSSNRWLTTIYNPFRVTLWEALKESLGAVVLSRGGTLNPVLWTMKFEFVGSCGLYLFYFAVRNVRLPVLAVSVMVLATTGREFYVGFALGAILFELWQLGKLRIRAGWLILLIGAVLPSELVWSGRVQGPGATILLTIAATSIVYFCLLDARTVRALSAWPSRFLGRVSFPFYLVHFPILYTVGAAIYVFFESRPVSIAAMFFVTLPLSLGVAYLGEVWVDDPAVRGLRRIPGYPTRR